VLIPPPGFVLGVLGTLQVSFPRTFFPFSPPHHDPPHHGFFDFNLVMALLSSRLAGLHDPSMCGPDKSSPPCDAFLCFFFFVFCGAEVCNAFSLHA